ncbi:hypothetical protein [Mycolicibacterium sp.]|uniref:hypothetical protein n=1 Tax=Mycolicibacterium sp. TaxID=2320850 RepID=UPI0037C809FA
MVRIRIAVAAAPMVGAIMVAASPVVHASPDVVGQTFGEASSTLQSAGYTPIVVNKFGGRTDQPDCTVTRQQDRPSVDGGGQQTELTLNCNYPVAAPGMPGNSAASPAGRAAAEQAVIRVGKDNVEKSLLSQLDPGPGASWAQCSGDLVGEVDSTVDCTVLADQEKHTFTLTVTDIENGQISYNIAQAS